MYRYEYTYIENIHMFRTAAHDITQYFTYSMHVKGAVYPAIHS